MAADLSLRRAGRPVATGAIVVVALQIAYPLTVGTVRDVLTALIVVLLAATWAAHACFTRGPRCAVALVLLTALPGFVAEIVGVRTGFPFGSYGYTDALGVRVAGVPVVIAFAWTMMAWPAALAARRLARSLAARVAVGAWALASADLFLDPQMVAAGYWHWDDPSPHLPGVPDVPLTNYAGWVAVAVVLSAALQVVLARSPDHGSDLVPFVFYVWLWIGWIVALAGFLDLRAAAGWGAIGMGAVAGPLAFRLRR